LVQSLILLHTTEIDKKDQTRDIIPSYVPVSGKEYSQPISFALPSSVNRIVISTLAAFFIIIIILMKGDILTPLWTHREAANDY